MECWKDSLREALQCSLARDEKTLDGSDVSEDWEEADKNNLRVSLSLRLLQAAEGSFVEE